MRKPSKYFSFKNNKLAWSVAAAITMAGSVGNQAFAQVDDDEQALIDSLEEITITGTRIKRQDYNSANPIATFGAEEMENLGIVNVGDAINQMPSNVSQFQVENTGGSAFFIGSTLANLRGLNPFFGTRTLTLVDTRRHVPTNQGGSVDLNFIPSLLVERFESVTGGASASYGSEAISGVVNIILDKDFEGIKFDADYGVSGEGDGDNIHYGFAFGTSFADGRGHFMIGGESQDQDVIQDCYTARDWCARGSGTFSNGTGGGPFDPIPNPHPYTPTIPGEPQNILTSNLRYSSSENGMIFNNVAGAQQYRFNDAGTDIVPFDAGQFSHIQPMGTVIGGEGKSIYDNLTLMPEFDRSTIMARASYDFTDTITGFVEYSWGEVKAFNKQDAPAQNTVGICIGNGLVGDFGPNPLNAYLEQGSDAMRAEIEANHQNFTQFGCQGTYITKDFTPETDQTVSTDTEVERWVFGLNGEFSNGWLWDAYYQYGETTRDQIGHDYRTNHRFTMAVDTMIDPATGQPDCRVNVLGVIPFVTLPFGADPSLAEGCQPLNPFGQNNVSQEALDYAYGSLTEFNTIEQSVAAFNVSGEIWEGFGAGALLAAAGIEYRQEELLNDAGDLPFTQRTDFGLQYGDAFGGEVEILEYYSEFEMPLLADVPGAEILSINAAIRRAEYTNTGGLNTTRETVDQNVTTWKVSGIWDPVEWLRIRGSKSRDIRAAGFRELYYSQTIPSGGFFGAITNPWLPDLGQGTQRDETQIVLSGNPQLTPEEADTETFGFVLTPSGMLDGLQLSVDYYHIDLVDGIALGNFAPLITECFDGIQSSCDFITFGEPSDPAIPESNVISVRSPYFNANPYEASGVDFSVNYNMPVDTLISGASGDLNLRVLSTKSLETLVQSAGQIRDIAGQTGGDQGFLSDFAPSPDWSTNVILSYINGPLVVTTQARYISGGVLDKQTPKIGPEDPGYDPDLTTTVTKNSVPSYTNWSLTASYNFQVADGNMQVFANINNLFDKTPPFAAGSTGGTNPQFFDALGRMFRVGVRTQF